MSLFHLLCRKNRKSMKKFLTILQLFLSLLAHAQQDVVTDSIAHELQEIVVTAKQPATKLVGTALVSTIAGSNLQNLGTAFDVLNQLPMIKVVDDAVTIVGKGTPEIYIDGRPMRSDEELMQLQSNNINKIELEMAPGAMYASGTKAVLKITTRHIFVDGLSFIERGEVTVRRKWSVNNMLDFNYHTVAWDFFASGLIARNNSLIKGTTTNTLTYDGKQTVIGSSQHKNYPSTNGMVKAGFNYSSGDQSLGGYYRYNPEQGHFSNIGEEWLNDEPRISRNIYTGILAHSHRGSVYYDNTFDGKYLLHFDGDYKNSYSDNNVQTTYPNGNTDDVHSSDTRKSSLWAGKLYLSFPLANGSFTIGTQDSYTNATLDYLMLNQEISEYIPSSFTEAKQTSAAAFASWKRRFGNFNLYAGLRYEYVDYLFNVNGIKNKEMSRTDNYLTPDISLGYSFNEQSQVGLSYKMATVKPPYSQLTGSLSYVGMHEIEGGNPALKDERMHDVQFFSMWKGFMLQANYTRSIDTYAFVKRVYPAQTLQLLMRPVNIDVSAVDVYLVWSQPIKTWTPDITLGIHKQWLEMDGIHYNRPIISYYFDNIISLPKGFLVTLNASGQSQGDMHTNRFGTTWFTLDASISKSLFNKSLQLKISATDIFNTSNNQWTMNTYGIFVNKQQTYDHRGISISLSYSFQPRKIKYKGEDAAEAEMNRL